MTNRTVFAKEKIFYSALICILVICCFSSADAQKSKRQSSQTQPIKLPAVYVEDRFYVQPVTTGGAKLNFFTDTGGGLFIFAAAAEQLKLAKTSVKGDDGKTFETVALPAFKPAATIPELVGGERLFVFSSAEKSAIFADWTGMLGQKWFAGRVWTFDYLKKELLLRAPGDLPKHAAAHRVQLGFQTNGAGKRQANYPRINVTIDDEPIDLLFDTGASTELSAGALTALKDNRPAVRAASFVTASIFEKWRKKHPEWRVIEKSNPSGSEAMIEVPQITVAGFAAGPVWFTRKPDANFHVYMSQFMDKTIEGALGGSALKFFRVTVDYPNAVAVFEQ